MVIVDGNVHIFDKLDNNNLKQESFKNKLPFKKYFTNIQGNIQTFNGNI